MRYEKRKNLLQCGTCRKLFTYKELIKVSRSYGGVEIEEKVCPYCKAKGYTALKEADWFNKRYIENPYQGCGKGKERSF